MSAPTRVPADAPASGSGGAARRVLPDDPIDLRSDTVTRPTPAMRSAMAEAVVGDDVYGEDPTVDRLERTVAELAGFEAGLFVPSGTMGNALALLVHAPRASEVLAPEGAHVYEYELGGMALLAGLLPRLVPAPGGAPDPDDVRAAVGRSKHRAPTGVVVLENTHNRAGGRVVPLDVAAAVARVAREEGLPVHLDGARAWNAAAALRVPLAEVCAPFDSVSLCLSKGLGAPVGSVLVGSRAFVAAAHRYRKALGGGMRQAGVLAAAGLVAVETMIDRLGDDHARARAFAERIAGAAGVGLDPAGVETNMVYVEVADAVGTADALAAAGVLVNALSPTVLRFVTHADVGDAEVERAAATVVEILERAAIAA